MCYVIHWFCDFAFFDISMNYTKTIAQLYVAIITTTCAICSDYKYTSTFDCPSYLNGITKTDNEGGLYCYYKSNKEGIPFANDTVEARITETRKKLHKTPRKKPNNGLRVRKFDMFDFYVCISKLLSKPDFWKKSKDAESSELGEDKRTFEKHVKDCCQQLMSLPIKNNVYTITIERLSDEFYTTAGEFKKTRVVKVSSEIHFLDTSDESLEQFYYRLKTTLKKDVNALDTLESQATFVSSFVGLKETMQVPFLSTLQDIQKQSIESTLVENTLMKGAEEPPLDAMPLGETDESSSTIPLVSKWYIIKKGKDGELTTEEYVGTTANG
jgi:hypothetical protein